MPRFCIENCTNYHIDMVRVTVSRPLEPNETSRILETVGSFTHGHSDIGSFVIRRDGDEIRELKTWGKIQITIDKREDEVTFKITEKDE